MTTETFENGEAGRVACDPRSPWQVRVLPGDVRLADGRIVRFDEERTLAIRPGGRRAYRSQRYIITGEGRQSPCFWNGEDIRGSGGMPYQRMVPGTLGVFDETRSVRYEPDADYVYDYYWGTVKRHPEGRIRPNEPLLLDYDVWLCRYDAIVLRADGGLEVAEGEEEAPESRELLLPDPPAVEDGIVLAHVFTGWGEASLHDGAVEVSQAEGDPAGALPAVTGRYLDATPRAYWVEVVSLTPEDGTLGISVAAEGIDYGLDVPLTEATLRWSAPITVDRGASVPLAIPSAYGHAVDWGLSIGFNDLPLDAALVGTRFRIAARPHSVLNLAAPSAAPSVEEAIPVLNREALDPFRRKLAEGRPARVAFFGESTTRSGHWPYRLMRALRDARPGAPLYSSNVAVGGESSIRGARRYEQDVRGTAPDLVVLEYMLNDSGAGTGRAEPAIRDILTRLRRDGIPCLIVTNNGMNPLFCGSMRAVEASHALYRRMAEEFGCAFVGGFLYFERLHEFGEYFLTALKGNMVNHPYGNVDPDWGRFDEALGRAVIRAVLP
ncbi:hypothetical protein I8J29_22465 [Paenibacillus sp. MWE-103]|uniref:SGNH hydrolase-type esterase domain-containing protein n=1 Tax=Paenibacillus artemisiicola TaxID=1172618 RepID=A0ABS3WF72_9BACL|nr:GDSL-type esterase/lipase family protein [Paenibacillus artemisiicola]MBO7746971.1 hypothetical protein [Paenibacillus artemisiicola]